MEEVDYVNFDILENGNSGKKLSSNTRWVLCKPISAQIISKIFVFIFLADIALACWLLSRLAVLENGLEASVLNLAFYSLCGLANFG